MKIFPEIFVEILFCEQLLIRRFLIFYQKDQKINKSLEYLGFLDKKNFAN